MNKLTTKVSKSTNGQSLSRQRRRLAVLATYLGYPLMTGLWYFAAETRSAGLFVLVIGLALATLYGLVTLFTSWVWYAANNPDQQLDERQQRVRDRAYLYGYRGLAVVVVLVSVYAGIAFDNGWWLPTTWNQVQAVVWGVLLLALTLPTAILAWIEPDAPGE